MIGFKKRSNCFVITRIAGFFTFKSFKTLQFIIMKDNKSYKKVWFLKIPTLDHSVFVKKLDIFLEFLIVGEIYNFLNLIKYITYKVPFKFKILYLKI